MAQAFALASGALVATNLVSILIAGRRLDATGAPPPDLRKKPPVSLVVPVRGIENFTAETLERAFRLTWPRYELLFCVAHGNDPVIPEIEKAAIAYPHVEMRILVGDDRISANPKLNNCVKGWQAARYDWVILADSNVLMPPEYIQHLMGSWRSDSGLVCSTPLGSRPEGFWAEVECMFLNTQQARWQYAGEAVGLGFAQGKSMLWYKPMLDANGGIHALNAEIAEDAASTKLVNRLGLKVHLVSAPFEQPLGRRTEQEIWSRQARWSRLRRVTFPGFFAPEILLGVLPPLLLALAAVALGDLTLLPTVLAVLVAIYLPEVALARSKGWRLSRWSVPAMMVRDVMMPAIWLRAWIGGAIDWRGNTMTIGTNASELKEAPAGS
ncbi:ceramide glucosyltransferase [Shinella curvata]|uniref:Ceramide glucosyltransferase n=1 Tax=Shinella curvata TaxID=1817964 RepID=A0ABT8X9K7_9HYPH|nr:ceramide glucosyltransferase [Shinella curvata]MCJ8051759.1 ceramide glucosyltransferase [Shinella curvata]MDO6120293.1 ceramide glucosyltransferase [Shinella curvata]